MSAARRSTAAALDTRVWRDLTVLAAQGILVGLAVSLVLGLAVFAFA